MRNPDEDSRLRATPVSCPHSVAHRPRHTAARLCRFLPMLLAVFGGQLLPSTADADYNLAEFNNSGFGWLWGDFSETIGTSEVRLRDSSDGWGGAGFDVNAVDFSSYADEYLVIDFTPEAANGVDYFDIEFIEGTSGSSTTKSGKWRFDLSGTTPGVATTLTSTTTLSSPADGVGDYQNLDLSQIQKWQVLGEYGSSETFDMRFDNIALTGTGAARLPRCRTRRRLACRGGQPHRGQP